MDFVVVRELIGGVYFGEHTLYEKNGEPAAQDIMPYTEHEIRRIAHVAFQTARKRRKIVTSVDKANVLATSRLWRKTVSAVAEEYPDVELRHMYVDNASMQMIRDPSQFDVIVTGDIGCYSLGVFPPLSRTDVILCMGGGFSMSQGMVKAGEKRPVVGIVGDSTFFHSGITGLLDIVYNKGNSTLIVVDNRTTAMTGHQDHPGTGRTLMGEPTAAASIEKIAEACGMKRIRVVDPYRLDEVAAVLKEELAADEPSLIISRAPCLLKERKPVGPVLEIDREACRNCRSCLKLGCPAIESSGKSKPAISAQLCAGCDMCRQVCRFSAIRKKK